MALKRKAEQDGLGCIDNLVSNLDRPGSGDQLTR
jgi:hypothetical protein